jgi:hypothetical protein
MRSLLLLVALAACKGADDTDPTDETDTENPDDTDPEEPDTDDTDDTDPGDTDDTDPGDTDDTDPGDTDDTDTGEACTTEYWLDADLDGYGGKVSVLACELPDGYSTVSGDCDDTSARLHPDADETCDGRDEDCDGDVDEDPSDGDTFYTDADGDGHGDATLPVTGCDDAPAGAAAEGDDCDESDATIYPGAKDACLDGIDSDCDGADDACFPASGTYDYTAATATFEGGTDENFGEWLAHGGDLDGDGLEDLLVAANGRTSSSSASRNGAMWFVYGDPALAGTFASSTVPKRNSDSRCLEDLDGVGDVDGDGYDDMLVGTTCWWYGGGVMLAYGSSTRLTGITGALSYDAAWEGSSYTYLGGSVAGGDFDGDGFSDLMFADQTSVYVEYGGSTRLSGTSAVSGLFELEGGAYAMPAGTGDGLASGDVDGDGIDDLLAYDYYDRFASGSIPGEVHLLYGDSAGWSGTVAATSADAHFVGPSGYSYVGMGMATTSGDLDGDGYDEVIAASTVYDSSTGAVWVFAGSSTRYSGDTDTTGADFVVYGASTYAHFASDVEILPDMDGAEGDELLVGSDGYGAYLFRGEAALSGTYTTADATAVFDGAAYADGMGESVLGGDFDGDGLVDVVVGSGDYSLRVGKMYFFAGSSF